MDSNHTFLWSKFETQTKRVFNNLVTDTDFLDVTLITDDEKQIKAHKVILSSCSSFFRRVLSSNPHKHPLLYLKGVSSSSLGSILQFIYLGEVNIALDHLDSFIQASEDLQILGILDVNQDTGSLLNKPEQRAKRRRIESTEYDKDQLPMKMCDEIASIQEIIDIEHENNVEVSSEVNEDDDIVEIVQTTEVCETIDEAETIFCDKCEFETLTTTSYEEHIKNDHLNEIPCKECKFTAKNNSILKEHMLADHRGLPCNNCHKRFSGLSFLRNHVLNTSDCRANILK